MTTSLDQVHNLYQECGGDLTKVAERLDIPYSEFVTRYGSDLAPPPQPAARRRPPPEDLGVNLPPNQKYIVAVRHADNPMWPPEYKAAVDKARADYEAGTHEMVQGRDRNWFVLYSIPRKQRCEPRQFFQTWT